MRKTPAFQPLGRQLNIATQYHYRLYILYSSLLLSREDSSVTLAILSHVGSPFITMQCASTTRTVGDIDITRVDPRSPQIEITTVLTRNYYCVCVFCVSSHPFWTSSSLDVPAGVTQEEGHTGFLIHLPSAVRALIFVARRIQPFLSLVDREVEFCVLTN